MWNKRICIINCSLKLSSMFTVLLPICSILSIPSPDTHLWTSKTRPYFCSNRQAQHLQWIPCPTSEWSVKNSLLKCEWQILILTFRRGGSSILILNFGNFSMSFFNTRSRYNCFISRSRRDGSPGYIVEPPDNTILL